jgi:hypothetical protein
MVVSDSSSSFDDTSVAAILAQRSRVDRKELLDELVSMLSAILPDVRVERSLLRRRVTAVRVPVGGYVYVLTRTADDSYEPSRQQVVRGVAVRTVPLEIDAFLEELGTAIDAELSRTERGRAALEKWLKSSNS